MDFHDRYNHNLKKLKKSPPTGFRVLPSFVVYKDDGVFEMDFTDYECVFASTMLAQNDITKILDVGSYRQFVFGLAAHYEVTALDIRPFEAHALPNGLRLIISEAKDLDVPTESFDAVVSLCSIEHFGLGRYGDSLDMDADLIAMNKMKAALRVGGVFIFSVPIHRNIPMIMFNAHRIYDLATINNRLCRGMRVVFEKYLNRHTNQEIDYEDVTDDQTNWAVYMGCWRKE